MSRITKLGMAVALGFAPIAMASDELLFDPTELDFDALINTTITSVSKKAERLQDAAAAVFVLTNEDIRRAHVKSIPDALRLVPGVQVSRSDSSGYNVNVRGTSGAFSNKLLILVDGRIVYNPLFGGVIWEAQDVVLEDIDRIEIIRGPGGTLWGANAVNGVINIISKSAKDTQGSMLVGGVGTDLHNDAVFRHGGALGDAGHFRIYAKHLDGGRSFRRNAGATDNWVSNQGGFRIDFEASGSSHVLQGDSYKRTMQESPRGMLPTHYYGNNLRYETTRKLTDQSDYFLQMYWDYTQLDSTSPATGSFEEQRDTLDFEFRYHYDPEGMHNLIWGLGYRFVADDIQATVLTHEPEEREDTTLSFMIQDEISLTEKLKVVLGTKVEENDYSGGEVQPNARFSYRFDDTATAWGAISRAVRVPTRLESDLTFLGFGDKTLGAEVLIAYELGYRTKLAKNLSLDMATFLHDYDELIFFTNPIDNSGKGKTWGLELSSRWQPRDWWMVDFTYTWLQQRLGDKSGKNTAGAANSAAHSDPANRATVYSRMQVNENTEFDATLRYKDDIYGTGAGTSVPSYVELDLGLTFRLTDDVSFALAGRNLLDDHHPEVLTPASGLRSEVQRSVHGTVTWKF